MGIINFTGEIFLQGEGNPVCPNSMELKHKNKNRAGAMTTAKNAVFIWL